MSISRLDVGTPPEDFPDGIVGFGGWTSTEVCFHGFANLPTTRDEYVESPEFSCFGHQWALKLYPGGRADSVEGYAAIGLANKSYRNVKIQYAMCVRNADGKKVVHHKPQTFEFCAENVNKRYKANFADRSRLVNYLLVKGALVIEVLLKLVDTDKSMIQFIPTNPINKNVLQKFMDEESADVLFEVDNVSSLENEDGHANKKPKSTTTFYAHRFILQDISTMMAELCKSDEGGGITTVSIKDVKPEIFKHMIYYSYGGKLSEEELKTNAKDIINACDKYGVVHLKLEAEASYVSNEITMDNIMDNLLYADSKNLALLKESVMDYIVANKHSIIGKVSFSNVPGDLVTDVLTAMARGEQQTGDGEEEETIKYNKMRVGTLRKMLDEKGLDVDGSRESMIALLKERAA